MLIKKAFEFVPLLLVLGAVQAAAATRCKDYVPQPRPQNTTRSFVGADLDTIEDRGYITFAAYEDFPPWSFDQDGKPAGVDIEIGKLIANEIGVEARFMLVTAGENLQTDLRNWIWKGPIVGGDVANVMLHVPYDSEFACRVEQVVFTGQYHDEKLAIAYRKDAYPEEPPVPAYFRFDTVAVENDTISDFFLTSFPGGQLAQNISRYRTMAMAMQGLVAGETMAAMGPLSQLEDGITDNIGVHTPPLPGFALNTWTIGVAVHFSYRPLGYAVDDAIYGALQDGRMKQIFARAGLSFSPPKLR